MSKSKLQYWTIELLLVAILIYVCTKISFLFEPIVVFVSTLFFPIIIAGFLFYLFNPVVRFLVKYRVPKTIAILLIYIVFIGVISLLVSTVGPSLSKQVTDLIENIPTYFGQARDFFDRLVESGWFKWTMEQDYVSIEKVEDTLQSYLTAMPNNVTNSLSTVIGMVTNITLVIVTVPFVLFYMLKDGDKLKNAILRFVPAPYRTSSYTMLKETNETLATYIQGQILVCLFVGVGTFIGYLIIDLPYAIVFALIGGITNIIPYVGPFIGVAPAFIVALIHSPTQALLVVVVVTVIQQLDGNLISPLVIGKKLNTHPLTIIILLLVAGNIAGILGMILAIPTYSVAKTIILNIVKFIRIRKENNSEILE
ncbi:AI-2E family transporter [Bacillus massiliglaciei]|uniref:AI-2E family transporter n=1 Tax=Bacillus massiliglaciei TaxID=1816693 RepID=UPI000AAA4CC6|nr:AI-2E family transporter [Bacillus massiliglaciei]